MTTEYLLSTNQQLRNFIDETTSVLHDLLQVDASIVFYLKKGYFSAITWRGCEAADLKINAVKSLIEMFDGKPNLILPVEPENYGLDELLAILQRMDFYNGLIAPIFANENLIGIWLIASKNKRTFSKQAGVILLTLANNISLNIQKELSSAEIKRHISEASAIYEITMEISQLLDLDRVLKVIVEKTCSLLNADISYIALADEKEKVVRVRVTHGARGEELHKVMHHYGDGIGGWVAATRTPLLVDNYYKEISPQSHSISEILATEGIISAICVPMFARSGLVGVLYATSRQEAAFDHSHLGLLQALGNQAAIAIENASLYAEQKLSAEKLKDSISTHERLLALVLGNQGIQLITDTLSELVQCPIMVENNRFQILSWSSKGYLGSNQIYSSKTMSSSKELWQDIESKDSLNTFRENKLSYRVQPHIKFQDRFSRVIVPIVRGSVLLGLISAIEVVQPLNDQQRAGVEEASIIFALEFLKQETARASMLQHVIAAQEEERKRIARELHDETSQAISALMIGLDSARMDIVIDPEEADQRLATCKSIAVSMLDNIHHLITFLRPYHLDDLGLVPAIKWYCEQRLKPLGIDYKFEYKGLKHRLPSAVEIALYRIIQEGITNIIRHANASTVTIRLTLQGDYLLLTVEDNGQGFDPRILESPDILVKSIGLWGIQERVNILKGDFHMQTAPGKGTRFEIHVPVTIEGTANG